MDKIDSVVRKLDPNKVVISLCKACFTPVVAENGAFSLGTIF